MSRVMGNLGVYLGLHPQDKLIEHKRSTDKHGLHMPEIRNVKWV